jgi:glycosyltransferase involved in cell wall biosynthesis
VKDWPELSPKIKLLREKGATVILRKDNARLKRFVRLFSLGLFQLSERYLNQITAFNPDSILVSQGTTFEFFYSGSIFSLVQKIQKPYSVISQYNVENGWNQSEYIKNLVTKSENRWNHFYFVSERNLKVAERQLATKIEHSKVICNPININKVAICEWPTAPKIKLACVARYECSYKGQDILLETLAEPEFSAIDFTLNFFGHGPDKLHLQQLVGFYQLEKKVFIGSFANNIDEIWREHHALVLPSISEGTPLSLQEAMLKGRTALITDVGGNSTLVIDGETGFLAATASVNSLKEKLLELFNTPLDQLMVMGEKAFARANKEIDLNASSKILEDIQSQV